MAERAKNYPKPFDVTYRRPLYIYLNIFSISVSDFVGIIWADLHIGVILRSPDLTSSWPEEFTRNISNPYFRRNHFRPGKPSTQVNNPFGMSFGEVSEIVWPLAFFQNWGVPVRGRPKMRSCHDFRVEVLCICLCCMLWRDDKITSTSTAHYLRTVP